MHRPSSTLAACPASWYLTLGLCVTGTACVVPRTPRPVNASLERRAFALLDGATEAEVGDRQERALRPAQLGEYEPALTESPREPLQVDLTTALETAFQTNRGILAQKDSLYVTVLNLMSTRHGFTPQFNALLATTFNDSDAGLASLGTNFSGGFSQILDSGGVLTLSGATSWDEVEGSDLDSGELSTSLAARISQPLLRGYGYAMSHEALIQGERSLLYAIRSFELFRENFAIDVAQRYYSLVSQQTALTNQRQNIEVSIFQREKAEALGAIGKVSQIEVLRAKRRELQDRNSLIQAEQAYELSLDRFKIFLGLDTRIPLEIVNQAPVFIEVNYDPDAAIEVAFANRLDYLTRVQQLEDAARGLRISNDQLRSDLDLNVGYNLGFEGTDQSSEDWTAGLTWSLPVDRVREHNAYRANQLGYARTLREFEQFEDELEINIRNAFRELDRVRESIDIQDELIVDQRRNLKKAQIEFEAGSVSNREVQDAQQALVEAQNSLIEEQVAYEIARLRLLQSLGILFVDQTGIWREP